MNHLLIAPVVLPAVIGPLIIMWMRNDLLLQRVFSIVGTALLAVVGIYLNWIAASGEVFVYRLGNWAAPFGIVLVLDRLAAMMVLLTAVLALAVQLYAVGSGWDRKGWHFHALWQFQLMGICGAFLTGDAFNLFVFFEVLLIASYGLMIHGGGEMRLRAGVQYIAYNLAGSTLFLAGLGVLYSVTGTLNMADMAMRVAQMPAEDTALLRAGAVLTMLVFAIKAALVPLHFWLPSTYANAPGPVAALFAIMTKVGVYAIIRFYTLIFPQDAVTETLLGDLLLPAALLTLALGQVGILGTRHLGRLASYAAIGSIGTLVIAVAQYTPQATSAAIYYLIHSTLATGALFLVVDLIGARRGDLWLRLDRVMPGNGMIAALYFITAIALVGMPPFSGFVGKLLVLQATADVSWSVTIWSVILITSLIAIYGLSRAGSLVFWKCYEVEGPDRPEAPKDPAAPSGPIPPRLEPDEQIQDLGDAPANWLALTATGLLLAGIVAMTVLAGPAVRMAEATAQQLHDPAVYIGSVLQGQEGTK
ncbi:multisubunit potassium/proton antiporter, PhaD subunit (TC 2.A.63.1.1) [Paracoccus halophilus]|uniref:Cation:proton antiporter n=1 Tax=Paracoccus halophilus TaxID=376733 RepID=A0A099F7Q8_9RHOB|nr:monovalent cation/H+ antiporter subunit D [Paracoccus halophilus]KGJ06735.1 cation:proton antiporter [Paracoccus halophilus]SFA41912.1 multisubunit potassium/proton antiporter, PhaD subunit (TC 2.A.63.1.1) [Paracoccus halophilus]